MRTLTSFIGCHGSVSALLLILAACGGKPSFTSAEPLESIASSNNFCQFSHTAPSVPDARIRDLTFENLTLGGKPVRDAGFFKTNEFVDGLIFSPCASQGR